MNHPLTIYRFPQVRSACPSSTWQVNNSWSLTQQRRIFFFHSSPKVGTRCRRRTLILLFGSYLPLGMNFPGQRIQSKHQSQLRGANRESSSGEKETSWNTFSWETESVQDKTAQVVLEIKKERCSHRQLSAKHGESEPKNCTLYQTLQGSSITGF